MKRAALAIATVCRLGRCPLAPGTAGALVGVLLYLAVFPLAWQVYLMITAALFVLGVWASTVAEEALGGKDPSQVIIDEVVGYLITMFCIPFSIQAVVIGFALNRVLDIIKPYPANKAEKAGKGLGIMADDLVSSIYANILLRLILYFL
ncbi:MAG: phosphatidylglycerophosphatase A [Candidatus Tritonobacter lacicola]|nr:phosphatidylglycerophosphatase A [Candidatus Tritonobacter lacicola]